MSIKINLSQNEQIINSKLQPDCSVVFHIVDQSSNACRVVIGLGDTVVCDSAKIDSLESAYEALSKTVYCLEYFPNKVFCAENLQGIFNTCQKTIENFCTKYYDMPGVEENRKSMIEYVTDTVSLKMKRLMLYGKKSTTLN